MIRNQLLTVILCQMIFRGTSGRYLSRGVLQMTPGSILPQPCGDGGEGGDGEEGEVISEAQRQLKELLKKQLDTSDVTVKGWSRSLHDMWHRIRLCHGSTTPQGSSFPGHSTSGSSITCSTGWWKTRNGAKLKLRLTFDSSTVITSSDVEPCACTYCFMG